MITLFIAQLFLTFISALGGALVVENIPPWLLPSLHFGGSAIAGATAGHFVSLNGFANLPLAAADMDTAMKVGTWWVIAVIIAGGLSTLLGLVLAGWAILEKIKGKGSQRTLTNNPVIVAEATRFVENSQLTLTLSRYVSKDDLRNSEQRIEGQIDQKFTALDTKRSEDIGDLHKKIEATTESLRAEIEDKMREVRSTINDLPERLFNMLRGHRKP